MDGFSTEEEGTRTDLRSEAEVADRTPPPVSGVVVRRWARTWKVQPPRDPGDEERPTEPAFQPKRATEPAFHSRGAVVDEVVAGLVDDPRREPESPGPELRSGGATEPLSPGG